MAVISIAANLVLIPRYGLEGAAWAAVGAGAFSNAAQTFFVRRNGIPLSLVTYLKPHLLLAVAASVLFFGGTPAYRVGALLIFIAGAFIVRLVTPKMLWNVVAHLAPGNETRP